MSRRFHEVEQTPWLGGDRVRRYNPTLALLALLIPTLAGLGAVMEDPDRFALLALVLVASSFAGLLLLVRRSVRGVRLNNGAVALLTRGEDLGASNALRAVVRGWYGRDVVSMSLFNLGVLALRSLDLPSAAALYRAAIVAAGGFRFRWQTSVVLDLARGQLAFVLAASGASLEEAVTALEASSRATSPQAIAFAARARAMIAARGGRFEEVVEILDGERALLRNVLPLNDAVLCEALGSYALARLGNTYRGASRPAQSVLADDLARAYVRRMLPEAETALVSA